MDDHNPDVLYEIAEKTCGTYSFIYKHIKDQEAIKGCILPLIRCLKSIVATDMRIVLRPQKGVAISSLKTGAYDKQVNPDSTTIDINDISAGETKKITVLVDIVKEDEQSFVNQLLPFGKVKTMPILTVDGEYTDTMLTNNKVSIDKIQVSVKRQDRTSSGKVAQVAKEEERLVLVSCVSKLIDNPTDEEWDEFKESYGGVPQDISELVQSVRDADDKAKITQARPYMLSWLSSERWQRQTTKGDHSHNLKAPHSRLGRLPQVIVALAAIMVFTLQGGGGPAPPMPAMVVFTPRMDMKPVEFLEALPLQKMAAPPRVMTMNCLRRLLQYDDAHCSRHQIQYLQPFLCLVSIQYHEAIPILISIIIAVVC